MVISPDNHPLYFVLCPIEVFELFYKDFMCFDYAVD